MAGRPCPQADKVFMLALLLSVASLDGGQRVDGPTAARPVRVGAAANRQGVSDLVFPGSPFATADTVAAFMLSVIGSFIGPVEQLAETFGAKLSNSDTDRNSDLMGICHDARALDTRTYFFSDDHSTLQICVR